MRICGIGVVVKSYKFKVIHLFVNFIRNLEVRVAVMEYF